MPSRSTAHCKTTCTRPSTCCCAEPSRPAQSAPKSPPRTSSSCSKDCSAASTTYPPAQHPQPWLTGCSPSSPTVYDRTPNPVPGWCPAHCTQNIASGQGPGPPGIPELAQLEGGGRARRCCRPGGCLGAEGLRQRVLHRGLPPLMEVVGPSSLLRTGSPGALLRDSLEAAMRRNLVMTFGGGTNEVQREIIARAGLANRVPPADQAGREIPPWTSR